MEKKYYLTEADGKVYESETRGRLGGYRGGGGRNVYGLMNCPRALRALAAPTHASYESHRVFFADELTALSAGYRPCGVCLKSRYLKWCENPAEYEEAVRDGVFPGARKHEMGLSRKYFDFVKCGTKRVELRLFDEKRRGIMVGDMISFSCEEESVTVRVIDLILRDSFEEIAREEPIELLADKTVTPDELLSDLAKFYPSERQKEYGAVGIRFEIIE